ncbi:hypothetical protein CK820_G0029959 [Pan troglodytes]|uniref:Uncharacterized protein n=1 Tax=Pan troglodytes TaxID=9598 RepID=A0A2J8QJE6_PANTR|nr:hypothetical protein CK820_G0029959 [Pan troglodytes]
MCQLFTTELGWAGIRWETEAHHDQKLFPYGEHLEMAMLNHTVGLTHDSNGIVRIRSLSWEEFLYGKADKTFIGLECLENVKFQIRNHKLPSNKTSPI